MVEDDTKSPKRGARGDAKVLHGGAKIGKEKGEAGKAITANSNGTGVCRGL